MLQILPRGRPEPELTAAKREQQAKLRSNGGDRKSAAFKEQNQSSDTRLNPLGANLDSGYFMQRLERDGLTEIAPDVHRVLAENAPKAKPGPKANGHELGAPTHPIINRHGTHSATVLAVRLARLKADR